MAWTNPSTHNIADFYSFVLSQGVPSADLPSGALTASIDTSGNLTATGVSGTISVGMVIVGEGIADNTYILTWNGTTGTVSQAPGTALTAVSSQTFSQYAWWAFSYAFATCLCSDESLLYVLAVYNLGMHKLLKLAQDIQGQTYFQAMRTSSKLVSFTPGVMANAGDEATSAGLVVSEFFKGLLVNDLDLIKTPWGLEYLNYKQSYGPYPVVMA